jgi:adenosylcobinamide-phosphate synthase
VARRGRAALAVGTLCGVALDAAVGDPTRLHPVAGFGSVATTLERWTWRPARWAGTAHATALVVPLVAVAARLDRALRRRPPARAAFIATATWTVLGGAGLRRHAAAVEQAVGDDDLAAARRRLGALCGRDASELDAVGLRRAVIESVAENTSDAAVAPLVWAALLGAAGLVGYRAVNTLDAMIGHRSERYRAFGYAAARLDDLANLVPARVTAVLVAVWAPSVGGSPARALAAWRRDGGAHPSPNAGVCEAAFAGALDLRLGGPIRYAYGPSDRPWLGDGRPPRPGDVQRAVALSRRVVCTAAAGAVLTMWWRPR